MVRQHRLSETEAKRVSFCYILYHKKSSELIIFSE